MKKTKYNMLVLEKNQDFRNTLVTMLQKMREVGQPLSTSMIQPIIQGMIESFICEVIHNALGGF
jgi:hypothetical protein